jgi:hypothetical protein
LSDLFIGENIEEESKRVRLIIFNMLKLYTKALEKVSK